MKANDGTLIHISTDYVFGKEPYNIPCREEQKGTPTGVYGLTKLHGEQAIAEGGVRAYSNEGACSWYDFTKAIAEIAGNTSCDIRPCHSDEFPSKVVRPAYSVLDKTKYKSTFNRKVPYWVDSLRKCIANIKENEA